MNRNRLHFMAALKLVGKLKVGKNVFFQENDDRTQIFLTIDYFKCQILFRLDSLRKKNAQGLTTCGKAEFLGGGSA